MGQGANLPARFLDDLLSQRAELVVVLAAVAVGLWMLWHRHRTGPTDWWGAGRASQVSSTEPPARRVLRLGLGWLWLLDGLLQAQPDMPRQFAPMVLVPASAGQPAWVSDLGRVAIDLWTRSTVTTDALTVFLQLGIGLAIVLGGDSLLGRGGLGASVLWGATVWMLGEGMGGLFGRGATWLTGAPGAAVLYVAAAVLLLVVPTGAWRSGRVGRRLTQAVGAFWVLAAAIQAWPYEGFWSGGRLREVFRNAASNAQPGFLRAPIDRLAVLAGHHAAGVNLVVVAVMVIVGAGLLSGRATSAWLAATGGWLAVTWWFTMDFGVLGGVGTDPNSAAPMALFVVAAWLALRPARAPSPEPAPAPAPGPGRVTRPRAPEPGAAGRDGARARERPRLLASWLVGAAVIATVWTAVPVVAAVPSAVATPASATAALVDSGGLAGVPGHPRAPELSLVDQNGARVHLATWRGKVVLLSFLDAACRRACPPVADELTRIAALLALRRPQIEVVSVDTNPQHRSLAALGSFDEQHHVASLPNWQFLTGSVAELRAVWRAYDAASQLPRAGSMPRSLLLYVVGPHGDEQAVTVVDGAASPRIEVSYAAMFAEEAARLLPQEPSRGLHQG